MKALGHGTGSRGFTLIEIIIGLSITAVLLGILLSALRLGHRSEEKGREREEISQRMRIISDRLTWLVRGAYPYTVSEEGETKVYFEGDSDSLGFVTTSVDTYSDGPEDLAGLKWVRIYVDSEGLRMAESVFFSEDALDGTEANEYVFDPTVTDIELEYLDIEPEEGKDEEDRSSGDWVSSWDPDDKDYIPAAVRMKVLFEHDGEEIEIPEIVAGIRVVKKFTQ